MSNAITTHGNATSQIEGALESAFEWPTDRARRGESARDGGERRSVALRFAAQDARAIAAWAAAQGVDARIATRAIWVATVCRTTGADELAIDIVESSARTATRRIEYAPEAEVGAWLRAVRDAREAPEAPARTATSWRDAAPGADTDADAAPFRDGIELGLAFVVNDGGLEARLHYAAALFARDEAERMLRCWRAALAAAMRDPARAVGDLPLLDSAMRREILQDWNATEAAYPLDVCAHRAFEAQATATPDAIALVFGAERLPYAELNARANRLARWLRAQGVGRGDRVALMLDRGIAMIEAILATLKAGAAYVPIATDAPEERLRFMLDDAQPSCLLADAPRPTAEAIGVSPLRVDRLADALATLSPENLDEESFEAMPSNVMPSNAMSSSEPAYIIYTSGTSGQPKGVLVSHRNLTNFCYWCRDAGFTGAGVRMTQFAPYTFDASAGEIFAALSVGAELHLLDGATIQDPAHLQAYMRAHRIGFSALPPAYLQQMDPALAPEGFHLLTAGSAPTPELARAWAQRGLYLNGYGPTETTILSTAADLGADLSDAHARITIGRPIANTRLYLLDDRLQPVPVGTTGEIWIGGEGVALGYWNQPALTAERFRQDPFVEAPSGDAAGATGARMYRTGDLGRWRPDGRVEFVGRNDFQVKIRGFRIELGEIEIALHGCEGVREALVVARRDGPGEPRLVAYCLSDAALEPAALRRRLAQSLPGYMVPSAFVRMDAWPLTANGKIDRKALPAPDPAADAERPYRAPEGEIETALAEIWAQALGASRVGRDDNFFELGGHSLLAISVIQTLRDRGFAVEVSTLFAAETLAALATQVRRNAEAWTVPPNAIPADADAIAPEMLPLASLPQAQIDAIVGRVPGGVRNVQDLYPLSPLQEGMLFHHMFSKEGDLYLLSSLLAFPDRARMDRFLAALQRVIDRHDVLRTSIEWVGLDAPVQVVHRRATLVVETLALDPKDGDIAAQLQQRYASGRCRLDLSAPPLLRLYAAEDAVGGRWLLRMLGHHIVMDHMGYELMLAEVREIEAGRESALPPQVPYRNFIAYFRQHADENADRAFFGAMLGDIEEPTLPYGLTNDVDMQTAPDIAIRELDRGVCAAIRGHARRLGISASSVAHLAWASVLARTSGRDSVVFGTIVFGRMRGGEGADRALGLFINTLPCRIEVDERPLDRALKDIHAALARMMEYEHTPLAAAQRCSAIPGHGPLFSALMNYRYGERHGPYGADSGIELLDDFEQTDYPMTVSVDDFGDEIRLVVNVRQGIDARRVCDYMERALRGIVSGLDASAPVSARAIDPIGDAERTRTLAEWNETAREYPRDVCVHRLFERQAQRAPEATALIFGEQAIGYAALNARANRLAHHLIGEGVGPGARLAVCVERTPTMLVAVLAALKAGAAYLPLDPAYPRERLAYSLGDADVALLLADAHGRAALGDALRADGAPRTIALDDESDWAQQPSIDPDPAAIGLDATASAYMIYTSGSTGLPKGTMIAHRSAVNLAYAECDLLAIDANSRVLQFASFAFDACVWEIFATFCAGATLVLPAPGLRLLEGGLIPQLRAHAVSHATLPPALLNTLEIDEIPRSLRTVVLAGEAPDAKTIDRLLSSGGRRVINAYGPTEATVCGSMHDCRVGGNPRVIGKPLPNVRLYIVDAHGRPAPIGVAGELWIGGAGVAQGYWRRPELTAERFVRDPFVADADARAYRTGDLARWRDDGTVEFIGRSDFQVKIRGFRVELGEIEAALAACEGVREAVVLMVGERADDKRLVAYWLGDATVSVAALRDALARTLPDYMIPSAFVRLDAWPLTANGKLDRRALPAPEAADRVAREYAPPKGTVEETLAAIWGELLKIDRVGRHDHFFELGGHSLIAMRLVSRVRNACGVELAMRHLFEAPTLAAFAAQIEAASEAANAAERAGGPHGGAPTLAAGARDRPLPLSLAQQRLWLLTRIDDASAAYHMPSATRLRGPVDAPALGRALKALVARHEALRTRFETIDGEPCQRIADADAFEMRYLDLRGEADLERRRRALDAAFFDASFDLERDLPLRAELLRLGEEEYEFRLVAHHIVADGWSVGIALDELNRLYAAERDGRPAALPPLALQYADFAIWQREWLAQGQFERQANFWKRALAGAPTLLELPTDRRRPTVQRFDGENVEVRFDPALTAALRGLAQRHDATLYMVLLAAWAALLSRLSNQRDIVIGSPVAGRNRSEVEPLVGFFVNTLAMRIDLDDEPTVAELIARTRRTVLEAQAHQDLPFDQVVEATNPARDIAHSPIFQVMLALENLDLPSLALPGVEADAVALGQQDAKFDLTLELSARDGGLGGHLNYATALFDRATVERHVAAFLRLLRAMAEPQATAARRPVSTLSILDPAERERVLYAWNATEAEFPRDACLHTLFEAQAARTPDAIALAHGDARLDYATLNRAANRLAHHLRARGIGPDARVGICARRGIDILVAMLATQKAGGAYVPLDPTYPADRLGLILDDAEPRVVLTDASSRAALADAMARAEREHAAAVLDLRADAAQWADASDANPSPEAVGLMPSHLGYLIYTSGSTGRPKGVAIEHRNAVNFVAWAHRSFSADELRDVLFSTSINFDLSIFETFVPLARGGTVTIVENALALLDAPLPVTLINTVPSVMVELTGANAIPPSVRTINVAGEVLKGPLAEKILASAGVERLCNLYGPSETTTYSTWTAMDRRSGFVADIGRPIDNTRLYILDGHGAPVPIGTPGELFIGGDGVARGYLGKPEMTAERFLDDPFVEAAGARMYRTGDLARWLPDGRVEYLGRNDFQVKIRGFRIELGEIETRLVAREGIREAVLLAREDASGGKQLVAYYLSDEALPVATLRDWVGERLPAYMVPSAFVWMAVWPLTPNGKLDRKALPDPDLADRGQREYVAPEGALEQRVAAIWRELLGVERVGRDDNFFELGGHSLIAVTMIERMRKQGLRADVRALFTAPDLRGFAASFSAQRQGESRAPENRILADAARIAPEMLPMVALTPAEIATICAAIEGGAANIQDIYPLSPLQSGILYHRLLDESSDVYHAHQVISFPSLGRAIAFVDALQCVVDRHDILRTAFVWDGVSQPVQVVQRRAVLPRETMTIDPAAGPTFEQLSARFDPATFRIDLGRAPLFRCCCARDPDTGRGLMCIVFHHLVVDHTSLETIVAEAASIADGRGAALPRPAPYRNYIWSVLNADDREAHRQFFRAMLGGIDQPTAPFGLTAMNESGRGFENAARLLPNALSVEARRRARELGVSPAALMHVAWGLVLARATGLDRVVFGTVLFGRMDGGDGADRALGLFINTLPLRIDLNEGGVAEVVRGAHRALAGLLRHEHAQLADANRCSDLPASTPLFTSLFNYRNSANHDVHGDAIRLELGGGGERTNYPLTVVIDDLGAEYAIGVQTAPSVGAERVCEMFETAIARLLDTLRVDPNAPAVEVDALPAAEFERVVREWNRTARDYPLARCAHALFEEQAARTPDATALVFGEARIGYAALNARADRVAHALRARGVGPGELVALTLPRGIDTIVAILATLKAGAAYVPMAIDAPAERLAFMLEDAKPAIWLTDDLDRSTVASNVPIATLDALDASASASSERHASPSPTSSNAPAYVIYTSGTTGEPKGVVATHRNLVNFCFWCREAGLTAPGERMTQFAPYTFDASAGEIFAALLNGLELHLLDDATIQHPQRLQRYLIDRGIDFAALPPAYLQQMDPALAPPRFRLLTAGSAPTPELVRTWAGLGPYLNGYGPTETTVLSTAGALSADEQTIGIGKPIANTALYLLDERRRPVPIGVPGEIWIGGAGVTAGYLHREALTAERFVDDPFADDEAKAAGARMYRTGDLGRWLPDGTVEFLGRNDFQVKIRGFRIELGEIEAKLCDRAGIREATVLAREGADGEKRLIAYCLTDGDAEFDAVELRARLSADLPEYMLPAAFVRMAAWPLTANGKIDRKALPAPDDDAYARRVYEAPETALERTIAGVWQELLDVERVGRKDDFFQLGGHSLLLMRMIAKLSERGISLTIRDIYRHVTVEALAHAAASLGAEPEAWLRARQWPYASGTVEGKRTLAFAPAQDADLLPFRLLLSRCAPELRPDRILLADDPAAALATAQARPQADARERSARTSEAIEAVRLGSTRPFKSAAGGERTPFTAMHRQMMLMPERTNLHVLPIAGWWSPDALREAFARVVIAQDMLRTVLDLDAREFRVLDAGDYRADDVPWIDLRDVPAADVDAAAGPAIAALRRAKTASNHGYAAALASRSDTDHMLLLYGDHLLWDGRSFDAIGEAIKRSLAGAEPTPPRSYRDFYDACTAPHAPDVLDRHAQAFGVRALSASMRATTRALRARRALPAQLILARFPHDEGDAAEQAFSIFRRLASCATGLDRFGLVLVHHGRRLGERDYFGQVGLFTDAIPIEVGPETTLEASMRRVGDLHRDGVRFVDWQASGDARVAGTMPPPEAQISFNWQPAIRSKLEIDTTGAKLMLKVLDTTGMLCEFFVGEHAMDMVFAYRGDAATKAAMTALVASASGELVDLKSQTRLSERLAMPIRRWRQRRPAQAAAPSARDPHPAVPAPVVGADATEIPFTTPVRSRSGRPSGVHRIMNTAFAGAASRLPIGTATVSGVRWRGALLGAVLLGVGILVGVRIGDRGEKSVGTAQAANAQTPMTVSVVRAERKSLADAVQVVGQTRSRDDVRAVAELAGLRVERIAAEAGDWVRAGQVLAVLDARGLRIDSEKSESELARARGEYERARTLVASQLVSREFFKQKETAYAVARAQHDDARLGLQRTRVVAPASGRVVRRNVAIGDLTDPSVPLFEIAKDDVVEMEANVPENLVGRLRQGMAASVQIAGSSQPVRGEIRLIQPNVDSATRATNVRIRLDAGAPLPVGAFGQATVDVARVEGWAVPRSALQQDEKGRYVWRVDEKGVVRRHPVTPTFQTTDTVIVAESLGGAAIVAKAGPFLRENDRVRVAPGG